MDIDGEAILPELVQGRGQVGSGCDCWSARAGTDHLNGEADNKSILIELIPGQNNRG